MLVIFVYFMNNVVVFVKFIDIERVLILFIYLVVYGLLVVNKGVRISIVFEYIDSEN